MAIAKFGGIPAARAPTRGAVAIVPVQLALGLRSLALVDDDAEMRRRFAFALNTYMRAKGWKAPDLAKAIKRDASTVSRWTKAESVPSIFLVKPIADALSIPARLLFDPPPVPEYPPAEYLIPEADAQRAADLARAAVELEREDLESEAAGRQAAARSAAARRGKRPA